MKEWEAKFDENTLERGRTACRNRRVMNLKQDGDVFRAGVLSRTRSEVTIKMRDGSPVQMSCSCPVPKSGRNCEHMAAVLYAIEMLNNPGEQELAEQEAAAEQRRDEGTPEKKTRNAGRKKTAERTAAEEMPDRKEMGAEATPEETRAAETVQNKKKTGARGRKKITEATAEVQKEEKVPASGTQQEEDASSVQKKPRKKRMTKAEKLLLEQQKAEEEQKRREEEQAALEEQRKELEKAKKETEEFLRQEKERQEKRDARKKRKEERARREEERRQKAEEARNKEYERLRAEEKKREEIKKQQELEEQRRAEKRRMEQEAARLADERRRMEEKQARKKNVRSAAWTDENSDRQETERKRLNDYLDEDQLNALGQGRKNWYSGEKNPEEWESGKRNMDNWYEDDWDVEGDRDKEDWPVEAPWDEDDDWNVQMEKEMQEWMRRQKIREENARIWQTRKKEFSEIPNLREEDTDLEDADRRIRALEKYAYFKGRKIRGSVKISKDVQNRGMNLLMQGKILLNEITSGHERNSGEVLGQMNAIGEEGSREFAMELIFSQTEVRRITCGCTKCRGEYYTWNPKSVSCPYKAGLLVFMEEYLKEHSIGDATDQNGLVFLGAFNRKHESEVIADTVSGKMNLRLEPRLIRSDGKLTLSFRVGENRMYVVKKLDEFCQNVKNSATTMYGVTTKINHNIDNFTESGKEWIRFINQIVREEQEFTQRLADSWNYYYGMRRLESGSSLNLYGWRLDEFYARLQNGPVEFEDKDAPDKKKKMLTALDANPKVTMEITADEDSKGEKEFHGICVKGTIPQLYEGTDSMYFINGDYFSRVDRKFTERIGPLTRLASGDEFLFRLGRNHMAQFYYDLLPQLEDIIDVTETEPEKFRSYLPPQVSFLFYLDAEDGDMTCRAYARYGKKEFSVFDTAARDRETAPFRNVAKENEILFLASQWFPEIDWDRDELFCGGDEQRMYLVLESGVEQLMELGEVHCTKRFLSRRVINRVKVSVGVSVAGGMLDLEVATDDVPQSELLDILKSYRLKKKYYRLKNGDFVNLEEQNLQMLAELMDSMHLKPKELIQGRMHLPMFRTLYLDRMLEENEDIYSRRDSHFREIIKGFKTVKDADYEEPESLSGIMRKYQKDGFKWLRTLETWKFGGILADDMGLGKTLQIIAVLLAAKQEQQEISARMRPAEDSGQTETSGQQESSAQEEEHDVSLVVAPASLVFNWGEEFRRFAPELSVVLVTGTQEERHSRIERWQEADVLVTSYDLLKRDIAYYEDKLFRYEIIDEAQYIKNHTTAAAKAVKVINSQIRFALTGTPIENRLSELWSIFDYLMPGFLYGYDVFRKELEIPIVKSNDEEATKRLQKMVNPFILRRLKGDVLRDLPEKLEEIRYVKFGSAQQKLYDGQVVHMKQSLASQSDDEFSRNKIQILAELTRLRQICCAPQLCFEDYHGDAAKVEACVELVQSAIDGEHRVLLFSQFTSMLDMLKERFDDAKIPYFMITGSTPKSKRLQLVKEFNEGTVPLFLISLKAGGVGLNLTGADVVIHYDPWWNQAVQNQATDRAHRIGQTKKVTVYKLLVKNSIEEKIQKLQEEKGDLAEQIIGGETGQLGSMSREELLALL